VAIVAMVAAAIASVTGFGVGSLLTPTLAVETGTRLAVAAVSVPHLVATAQRFWVLRAHVDKRVLLRFGTASGVGGLAGALIQTRVESRALTMVFGIAVLLAGLSELSGWMRHVRWGPRSAWAAGALSGTLGGMVGNQGGIRTAALLGFDVPKQSFVATATAIALFVDGARMPVYLATQWREMLQVWQLILIACLAAVAGTSLGTRLLGRIPEVAFRRVIAALLVLLGGYMMLARPG
jgi:uncharacterized membrane protein YfcA